jgi:hypothetical protein
MSKVRREKPKVSARDVALRSGPGAVKIGAVSIGAVEVLEQRLCFSTFTVNSVSDSATPQSGVLTLRQAVAIANTDPGPDTIAFDPLVFSTPQTITLTQGQLEISDTSGTTTITGPGADLLSISGGNSSRVFQTDSETSLSVSGLTITDGKATVGDSDANTYGGAIFNQGQLTIASSNISGNTVYATAALDYTPGLAMGGAIYSVGSLTVSDSTLSNNVVTNQPPLQQDNQSELLPGSAMGGAIDCVGSLTLSGDTIADNSANGLNAQTGNYPSGLAMGGGVYAGNSVTISNSSITGNTAQGGSAETTSYSANASGNASGGGLFVVGAATISGSTFTDNSAIGGESGLDSGSSGSGSGGAIYDQANLTISTSTIDNNTAKAAGDYDANPSAGGGVYAGADVSITQSSIDDNTLTGGPPSYTDASPVTLGGGLFAQGNFTIVDSSISGNTAGTGYPAFGQPGGVTVGGGIAAIGGGTMTGSTVAGNNATGGAGYSDQKGDYDPQPGGAADGGGLYTNGAITITNSTVANNNATGGSGGGAPSPAHQNAGANGANASGGGIYSKVAVTLCDSTVSGNGTGGGSGGGGSGGGGSGGGGSGGTGATGYPNGTDGVGLAAGVTIASGTALFSNSIVSGNTSHHSSVGDISGTASSASGFNFIGDGGGLANGVNGNIVGNVDPQLAPLANNGGGTLTMLPLAASPVIDAGSNALIPAGITTDQRGAGYPRIVNGTVDIGAVEYPNQPAAAVITVTPPPTQSAVAGQSTAVSLGSFTGAGASSPFTVTIDWGDGSTKTVLTLSGAGAIAAHSHTFANAGSDAVSISVVDADGNRSATVQFTVNVTATNGSGNSGDSGPNGNSGSGDGNAGSVPTLVDSVTSLSASTYLAVPGAAVTFTAMVTDSSGATPSGEVTFSVNGSAIGSAAIVSGSAAFTTSALVTGTDQVLATYGGDSSLNASASSPIDLTVQPPSAFVAGFSKAVVPTSNIAGTALNAKLPLLLTNNGPAAKGTFTIRYFASTVNGLDGNQVQLSEQAKKISIKSAKAVVLSSVIKSLPASLPAGDYYLVAKVTDPSGLISVAVTSTRIAVAAPFVNVSANVGAVTPAVISSRKSGVITVTLTNTGNIAASGVVTITASPSVGGQTPLPVTLVAYRARTSVLAGKSRSFRLKLRVPSSLAVASYFPSVTIVFAGPTLTLIGSSSFSVG